MELYWAVLGFIGLMLSLYLLVTIIDAIRFLYFMALYPRQAWRKILCNFGIHIRAGENGSTPYYCLYCHAWTKSIETPWPKTGFHP